MKCMTILLVLLIGCLTGCGRSDLPATAAASPHPATASTSSTPFSRTQVMLIGSNQIAAINAQLAMQGSLSISQINPQGYPIYDFTCDPTGKCVNNIGIPIGYLDDILPEMTTVDAVVAKKYGYNCTQLCRDSKGNIVGRLE